MAKEMMSKQSTPRATDEPTYEAAEIAANALRLFGYGVDLATAALDYNHIERCTVETARKIIKEFAERKVI